MRIDEVIEYLSKENLGKTLYFTKKENSAYTTYSPEVNVDILNEIISNAIEYLGNRKEEEMIYFNPTGYRDGTLEWCEQSYVGNYQEVIESYDAGIVENIEDDVEKLSFYCLELTCENESLRLFRRITKFKKLYSKGMLAIFSGNQLNKIEDKMLGIDNEVDVIAFRGELLVLKHVSLERIFKINEQFMVKAQETVDFLRDTNKISNFAKFEDDALNDLGIRKVLTKMLREGNDLSTCFDNFENVRETINLFDLQIEIENDGTLIYVEKRQIMDILRLARDSYYRSLIREEPGIDNKI